MTVNPVRHQSVFDPNKFGPRRVDVIGCGATGSRVALSLAKLGVEHLHLWDFDIVEGHNLANQCFGVSDIGKNKAEALRNRILSEVDTAVSAHSVRAEGTELFGDVVFLLTDTMESRRQIWERGIKLKPRVQLMIETRMGVDVGRVYAVQPTLSGHIKAWEETLYASDEAVRSACGTSVTVGPTADILAGYAVWQFVRWHAILNGGEGSLDNELVFAVYPLTVFNRTFQSFVRS